MLKPKDTMFAEAVDAWLSAANTLQIELTAPYITSADTDEAAIAFLPRFGSENGMLVVGATPPAFETSAAIREYAQSNGLYYSVLNLEKYREFDATVFIDALRDWGFFGSVPPSWWNEGREKR